MLTFLWDAKCIVSVTQHVSMPPSHASFAVTSCCDEQLFISFHTAAFHHEAPAKSGSQQVTALGVMPAENM